MIASDGSFVFVHVPKTAGNTISTLLAPHCSDILYSAAPFQDGRERFSVRNPLYPGLSKHSTLHDYWRAMGSRLDTATVVTAVRNPWERALSLYFWGKQVHGDLDHDYFDRGEFLDMLQGHLPTHHYLGAPVLSNSRTFVVIRQEHLQDDLERAWKILRLPGELPEIPRLNTSRHGPCSDYYDAELVELVARLEDPLVKAFGYEPPGHP